MTVSQDVSETYLPGRGILLMLVAWLFFSCVDTSVKWLVLTGLPATQLAFMRYFAHLLISLWPILRSSDQDKWAIAHPWLVAARAILLVTGTTLNFYVLQFLPLTITSAVMFSAPIIVCLLSRPLLGERVGPYRWFAIVLGFVGVLIVLRPFGEVFQPIALLTIYNAFAVALFSILTRKLAGKESAATQQFYLGVAGTVILLPFAYLTWTAPQTSLDWVLFLGLGAWAFTGHQLLIRAHEVAPSNLLMPFTYSFLIYLAIASWAIFGDIPDTYTVIGAIVIMASGLIIWARGRQA